MISPIWPRFCIVYQLEDELWVDLVGLRGHIVNFEVMLRFAFSTTMSAVAPTIITFLEKQNQHREESKWWRQEGVRVKKLDPHIGSCVSRQKKGNHNKGLRSGE